MQVYIGLFNSLPGEYNSGVEVSGKGYQRMVAEFSFDSEGATLGEILRFPEAHEDWGEIQGLGIFDAWGKLLFSAPLDRRLNVQRADVVHLTGVTIHGLHALPEHLKTVHTVPWRPPKTLWERLEDAD